MRTKDIFGRPLKSGQKSVLGKRWRWPPINLINFREGDWQNRKRDWISLGIRSELGRGETAVPGPRVSTDLDVFRHAEGTKAAATTYNTGGPGTLAKHFHARPGGADSPKNAWLKANGKPSDGALNARPSAVPGLNGRAPSPRSAWLGANGKPAGGHPDAINSTRNKETANLGGLVHGTTIHPYDEEVQEYNSEAGQTGTSIFDPALCELFYRWFTPKDGFILDPFAGGSVRGIVAAVLGRTYVGVDLRAEQIAANEEQAELICLPEDRPFWIHGDSRDIIKLVHNLDDGLTFDAVWSCPPYFDLELYSDDKRDLSNTTWERFVEDYAFIIKHTCSLLKNNRFAAFVIGDIRDKNGNYRNLPGVTIDCFRDAGLSLYNRALLATAVGSLPLRVHRQFASTRKLGNTIQEMLVFVKGDAREACKVCETYDDIGIDVIRIAENPVIVAPFTTKTVRRRTML